MNSNDIIGVLGLTLMSLLAILYWKVDVTIYGHIFFTVSILAVGMFTSYKQKEWSKPSYKTETSEEKKDGK